MVFIHWKDLREVLLLSTATIFDEDKEPVDFKSKPFLQVGCVALFIYVSVFLISGIFFVVSLFAWISLYTSFGVNPSGNDKYLLLKTYNQKLCADTESPIFTNKKHGDGVGDKLIQGE